MRKFLVGAAVAVLTAGGIALAPPASAGCIGGGGWGNGGETCDGPVINGWFQRCVTVVVLGWGGTNCYMVDINNMAGQHIPHHIGY